MVLALIPILLICYCYIYSYGSYDENGKGAVWWLILLYYGYGGIFISVISLYLAINSYKIQKNMLALLSIFIDLLPYLVPILLPLMIA